MVKFKIEIIVLLFNGKYVKGLLASCWGVLDFDR